MSTNVLFIHNQNNLFSWDFERPDIFATVKIIYSLIKMRVIVVNLFKTKETGCLFHFIRKIMYSVKKQYVLEIAFYSKNHV